MAKFYGKIGFGIAVETSPGVWTDTIIEYPYTGDFVRNSRRFTEGENLNNDLSVQNLVSIVADAYANQHFFAMRYVEFSGALWVVSKVDVQSPRLLLTLGGVYNGPKAA